MATATARSKWKADEFNHRPRRHYSTIRQRCSVSDRSRRPRRHAARDNFQLVLLAEHDPLRRVALAGATFDTNGNNINLSGTLTGTGHLNKVGDGTLTLTGSGSNIGALRVYRAPGAGQTSTLSLAGSGSTTVGFVGVGDPNNVGGLQGDAVLNVQDSHNLQVNGNLFLGEWPGNAGMLTQSGGTIGVTGQIRVGHWPNETSTYNMTGGTLNSTGGLFVGWDGVGDMDVTGNAIVNAAGVTIQRNSTLTIGGNADFNANVIQVGQSRGAGTLEIQGNATVDAMRLDVGNPAGVPGTVIQTGGTIHLTGGGGLPALRLGHWPNETSTYTMTGGTLNTDGVLAVGWDGVGLMNVSGNADVNVNSTTIVQRNSTLTIGGNASFDTNFFSIGDQRGIGNVVQNGGTVTVNGPNGVRVGHWGAGAGSNYDMSGGQLITPTLAVGWDGGNSSMDVTGSADVDVSGAAIVQNSSLLTIGGNATFDANFFSIGDQRGPGRVLQNGGTVTITGPNGVRLGHWAAGAGSTYTMTGGQLNADTLAVGWDGGNNVMDVSGNADVNVSGTALVQNNSLLNIGGNSTLDANFFSIGDQRGAGYGGANRRGRQHRGRNANRSLAEFRQLRHQRWDAYLGRPNHRGLGRRWSIRRWRLRGW